MKRGEVAELTFCEMWETYVEPNLKSQEALNVSPSTFSDSPTPMTQDERIAEAQAFGMMFGADPLEVGKAMRKAGQPTRADIDALRAKLEARDKGPK